MYKNCNIIQINSVINSGSTGRITEEIGQLVINNGWTSYIAYGRNDRPSKSHKIKIGNKRSVLWHVFLTRFFDLHGFGSKRATRKLIKAIEEIHPSIIHLHNIHGYYINMKILFDYLKQKNIPVVWTLHDCWTMTGHGAHFQNKKKMRDEEFGSTSKWEYPSNWLYNNTYWNYKKKKQYFTKLQNLTLVPVSDWLLDVVRNSFFSTGKVQRIYNGIDLNVFRPQDAKDLEEMYLLKNKKVFLGVATAWGSKKGLNDFIKLADYLQEDEIIILVGVTDRIIKKMPKKIIGIKRTESLQELAKFYSLSNVFLNLTYEDTFPTTNIEALACGTPVITYKTGGSPEAISKGTGFVVEQGDIKKIRQKLNSMIAKDKNTYLKNCRKRAEKLYDKNDRFQEYMNLYNDLLKKDK